MFEENLKLPFRYLLFLSLWVVSTCLPAQELHQKVASAHATTVNIPSFSPFSHLLTNHKKDAVIEGSYLTITANAFRKLKENTADVWQLEIPSTNETFALRLIPSYPIAKGAFVRTPDGRTRPIEGTFYQGIVNNDPNSIASISIYKDQLHGSIIYGNETYTLAPFKDNRIYTLTKDTKAKPSIENFCATYTKETEISKEDISRANTKDLSNCVNVYFELDYDVFTEKRSVEGATDYITAVFNEVNAIYVNEGINIKISEVFVWNIPSPYIGTSSMLSLSQFQTFRPTFNGDIAHLVDFRTSNGGIAYVDVLCGALPYAYSGAQPTFVSFPSYSWTIEVITHEIGHNLGSPHTHDCSWPDGAIDDCFPPSGNCERGAAPTNGGTIMSYCHLTHHGINFNNGFGTLPGDLIRNRVTNASCLVACDIGCPSPNNLRANNITQTSFNLAWTLAQNALNYTVQYRRKGTTVWLERNADTEETAITNLANNTTYEVQVAANCNAAGSIYSNIIEVITGSNPSVYCQSEGRSSQNEWIASISIHDYQKTSENNGGYADFTDNIIFLPINQEIPFSFVPGFTSGLLGENTYPEYWRMWIDLNGDGDFTDTGELIVDSQQATESTFNGFVTLPVTATDQQTRMRVSMKYNNAADPCEMFSEGEVEDYRILMKQGEVTTIFNESTEGKLTVYPNPAKDVVNVSASKRISELRLIDALGKTLSKKVVGGGSSGVLSTINVPNGLYFIEVIYTDASQRVARVFIEN